VIHTENSGFASPTLGQHISTFRGYQILFSIRKVQAIIVLLRRNSIYNNVGCNKHIFDNTVKQVLLYGSEVWGTSIANKINKEEPSLFSYSLLF
jgi:hypothetical protein